MISVDWQKNKQNKIKGRKFERKRRVSWRRNCNSDWSLPLWRVMDSTLPRASTIFRRVWINNNSKDGIIERRIKWQTDRDEVSIDNRSLQVKVPGNLIERFPRAVDCGCKSLVLKKELVTKKSTNLEQVDFSLLSHFPKLKWTRQACVSLWWKVRFLRSTGRCRLAESDRIPVIGLGNPLEIRTT